MLRKVRLDVNPETKVRDLGVGKQQLVEIAKALSRDVKLLVLDEPTAALNEDDCDNLFEIIRDLKSHGVTCVMISHKLREVIRIADTVTVLRDGQTICTLDAHARARSRRACSSSTWWAGRSTTSSRSAPTRCPRTWCWRSRAGTRWTPALGDAPFSATSPSTCTEGRDRGVRRPHGVGPHGARPQHLRQSRTTTA